MRSVIFLWTLTLRLGHAVLRTSRTMIPAGCAVHVDAGAGRLALADIRRHVDEGVRPLIVSRLNSNDRLRAGLWSLERLRSEGEGTAVHAPDVTLAASTGNVDWGVRPPLDEYIEYIGRVVESEESKSQLEKEGLPFAFDRGDFFQSAAGRQLASQVDTARADELLGSGDGRLVFSLGASQMGLTWHSHAHSWLELIAGEKRWWAAAHGNATLIYDATLPHGEWVRDQLHDDPMASPPSGVCSFTQLPGDIVWIPGLMHATFNLSPYALGYGRQDARAPPKSMVALLDDLADQFELSQFYPRTKALLADAIARYPREPSLALFQCQLFALEAERSAALEMCNRALELNPLYLEAHVHRMVQLEKLGRLDEARDDALQLLKQLAVGPSGKTIFAAAHPFRSREAARNEVHRRLSQYEFAIENSDHVPTTGWDSRMGHGRKKKRRGKKKRRRDKFE